MPKSFYRLMDDLGLHYPDRENMVENGIEDWDSLEQSEESLRNNDYGFLCDDQSHKLYAAIWFGRDKMQHITNKVEFFKFHSKEGFNRYYKRHFIGPNGELLYPFPSGNESSIGDHARFDIYDSHTDTSDDDDDDDDDDNNGNEPEVKVEDKEDDKPFVEEEDKEDDNEPVVKEEDKEDGNDGPDLIQEEDKEKNEEDDDDEGTWL